MIFPFKTTLEQMLDDFAFLKLCNIFHNEWKLLSDDEKNFFDDYDDFMNFRITYHFNVLPFFDSTLYNYGDS